MSHLYILGRNPSPKIQTEGFESREEARLEDQGMRGKQNSTTKSGLQGRGDLSLNLPRMCVCLKESAFFANYSMSLIFFLRCFLKIGTSIAPSSPLQNCNPLVKQPEETSLVALSSYVYPEPSFWDPVTASHVLSGTDFQLSHCPLLKLCLLSSHSCKAWHVPGTVPG